MLTRVFWFCSLAVLSVSATVDPDNTTVISVYGAISPDKPHYYNYNVTHTYFRDAFLSRGARFNGYKCVLPAGLTIDYWINESELPVSVSYVNLFRQRSVYARKAIKLSVIRNVMNALRNELRLPLREITRNQYYRNMRTLFARSRESSAAMSQAADSDLDAAATQLQYSLQQSQQQSQQTSTTVDIRNQLPSLSDYDDSVSGGDYSVNESLAVRDISMEDYYKRNDMVADPTKSSGTNHVSSAFSSSDNTTAISGDSNDRRGNDNGNDRYDNIDNEDDDDNRNSAFGDSTNRFAFQRKSRTPDPLIPIQIHFRKKPYPQSNFWQFITNNETSWRSYHLRVYPLYAGETDDLLYRFRHNFRHSLGLGHLNDTRSVMYPTNIYHNPVYGIDIKAVHQLLCSTRNAPHSRNRR